MDLDQQRNLAMQAIRRLEGELEGGKEDADSIAGYILELRVRMEEQARYINELLNTIDQRNQAIELHTMSEQYYQLQLDAIMHDDIQDSTSHDFRPRPGGQYDIILQESQTIITDED